MSHWVNPSKLNGLVLIYCTFLLRWALKALSTTNLIHPVIRTHKHTHSALLSRPKYFLAFTPSHRFIMWQLRAAGGVRDEFTGLLIDRPAGLLPELPKTHSSNMKKPAVLCDTARFGIDLISSQCKASIANTDMKISLYILKLGFSGDLECKCAFSLEHSQLLLFKSLIGYK